MEEKLKEFLEKKDYKKAIAETVEFLKSMDRDKIENWIVYKNVLLYNPSDKEHYTNFIKPLSTKLLTLFPELKEYISQIFIINDALQGIYTKLEKDFLPYTKGNMLFTVYSIACMYESFIHDLNIKLNSYIGDKHIERIMNVYQTNIDKAIASLNRIMNIIFDERYKFSNNYKNLGFEKFIEKMKEESDNSFVETICKLNSIEDVLEMVKAKEVFVNSYNGNEFQLNYLIKRLLKYDLPKMRLRTFENINFKKYSQKVPENFNLLKPEDIRQFIEIDEDSFKLKIDVSSKKFLTNLKTILIDAERYTDFIIFENYIDAKKMEENVVIRGEAKAFTFDDMIHFHIAILSIANFYYIAEELFISEKQKNSITSAIRIDRISLEKYISEFYKNFIVDNNITKEAVVELIDYYTFGTYDICDVFCTPLILCDDTYTIIPSVVMRTNFGRMFFEHINKLEISFKDGDNFEKNFKMMLEEHGFKIYNPEKSQLNFTTQKGNKGDIDVLAIKENYIFCAQLKNKLMPLDQKGFINYDRKLIKPLNQLKYVNEYLSENPKKILEFYGIEDLSKYKIIRFSVSNSFYRSGECIDGIYTTDMSALNVLFDSGKITMRDGDKKNVKYLRSGDKVTSEEFEKFLDDPYFMWEGVYL